MLVAGHQHLRAQTVTREEPLQVPGLVPAAAAGDLPDLATIPRAVPLGPERGIDHAVLESDTQSKHGDTYVLAGDVQITYRNRVLHADTVTYNDATGDVAAGGHVRVSGGSNEEYIQASHGTYNLNTGTGRFYDVSGSVGLHHSGSGGSGGGKGYVTANPFLFAGRLVVKTGPEDYEVYDGSVTSCLLPKPDWQLFGKKFTLDGEKARAVNSTFRVKGVPVLYLPYVTHPVDAENRQSGILIPTLNYIPNTKGVVVGEQVYLVLGRSADLTVGGTFYSLRGYSEAATFRYRGVGTDFFNAHFSALQDRGYTPTGGAFTNQGGQDVTSAFRRKFTRNTRAVGDVEYLSSYVYRQAFNESFNQAVSSDITSVGYLTRQNNGFSLAGRVDRYQGLKRVPINLVNPVTKAVTLQPGQQVRIFHAPAVEFTAIDHHLGRTPLLWNMESSVAALKRVQPNFTSSGIIERLDRRPELTLPLSGGGWHTASSVAVRETVYSRSRATPYPPGQPPIELTDPVTRSSVEVNVDLRPPAIERTFAVPARWQKLFGAEARHTVEPRLVYRNVRGINNFLSILRFDDADLAADTNELEYGVTQHVYFRPRSRRVASGGRVPCEAAAEVNLAAGAELPAVFAAGDAGDGITGDGGTDANGIPDASREAPDVPVRTHAKGAVDPCKAAEDQNGPPQQEWFSWKLAQRHFFDSTFGGAVVQGRRNLFDTTLSLSGIAFLTEPRDISPLISRMRFRTGSHTDVEWDFDLDTGAKKFTSSNIFLDVHEGPLFGGVSYAQLNAPGRFAKETIDTNSTTLVSSATSDFSQMRVLLGYGNPARPGLSLAGNAGLDLDLGGVQYGALQANYNWNCCGLAIEYRKFELGSVRNDNVYRFNFTLANIGTAGNLRRAERLF